MFKRGFSLVVGSACLFLFLICNLVACSNPSPDTNPDTLHFGSPTATSSHGELACPTKVVATTYWDPIVQTQNNVSKVETVTCGHLKGDSSLQALIVVRYEGTGQILNFYVYDKLNDAHPTQLFKLEGLYKGDAKISFYNTVITAEVDENSSVNKGKANAFYTRDLYREFKWSATSHAFAQVAFPGIYPDLTRYQAEADQANVNAGHDPWKKDAKKVANAFAVSLMHWETTAPTTIVSGGGDHDVDAVVTVKSTFPGGGTVKLTMTRLEGNTDGGIWIVTKVETSGQSITSPHTSDLIHTPVTVTGQGNAFEGVVGKVYVLDHLYDQIGNETAHGATGMGSTTFTTNVTYTASFTSGIQEGLIVFYSYSQADGSISGMSAVKVLIHP